MTKTKNMSKKNTFLNGNDVITSFNRYFLDYLWFFFLYDSLKTVDNNIKYGILKDNLSLMF